MTRGDQSSVSEAAISRGEIGVGIAISGLSVAERAQHGVHARLVAGAFRLEPRQHIGVDAERDRRFWRGRNDTATNHCVDEKAAIGFGVFPRRRTWRVGKEEVQISARLLRSRSGLRDELLCGTR